jgi:hypothetical protein
MIMENKINHSRIRTIKDLPTQDLKWIDINLKLAKPSKLLSHSISKYLKIFKKG